MIVTKKKSDLGYLYINNNLKYDNHTSKFLKHSKETSASGKKWVLKSIWFYAALPYLYLSQRESCNVHYWNWCASVLMMDSVELWITQYCNLYFKTHFWCSNNFFFFKYSKILPWKPTTNTEQNKCVLFLALKILSITARGVMYAVRNTGPICVLYSLRNSGSWISDWL